MRAVVIGTGAVAAFLGVALEERGFLPAFFGRRGPTAFTARVTRAGGDTQLVCCRAPSPDEVAAAQIAFVAVKAFDLEAALAWTTALAPGTAVIPVVNGLVEDIVRAAAHAAPQLPFRLGFSTVGVSALDELGCYAVRAKSGEIAFGALDGAAPPNAAERKLLDGQGVFAWHAQILAAAHRKWLYNVVINTLCAARALKSNGDLLGDIPMLAAVFNEAWTLGGERFGGFGVEKAEAYKAMERLIDATAANENSMARDKRLGRRTETPFLAGLAQDAKRFPLLMELARRAL